MQLISGLSVKQQALFKKRMQQCILATDMSRHMSDLNSLKTLMEKIGEGGGKVLPPALPDEEKESRRSEILELIVHAADISFLSRTMEATKTQAYALFEEFFH